jgi:hypothetical protein
VRACVRGTRSCERARFGCGGVGGCGSWELGGGGGGGRWLLNGSGKGSGFFLRFWRCLWGPRHGDLDFATWATSSMFVARSGSAHRAVPGKGKIDATADGTMARGILGAVGVKSSPFHRVLCWRRSELRRHVTVSGFF